MHDRHPLDRKILVAFQEAVKRDRMDVAEHLLRALETLQPDGQRAKEKHAAYRLIAEPRRRFSH